MLSGCFQGLQLHFKTAAFHAQLLHGAADRLGQRFGRLLALARDRFRRLCKGGLCALCNFLQGFQIARSIKLGQFLTPSLQGQRQIGGCFFVTTGQ